jgi:hypothetical protein
MEGSKVSVRTWYLAMTFMSFSKKGISAAELRNCKLGLVKPLCCDVPAR